MSNRLLLLDDNEDLLVLLVPLLEMNGYVTTTHAHPGQAAAALTAGAFDVLVYNHECDERAGALVSVQVAAYRASMPPVIVAYTSSTEVGALLALRALGVQVLAKPLDFDRLLAAIRPSHTAAAGCQVS